MRYGEQMSEIFVQLNTRSGMAYFYNAKLPEDAVEKAPEGTIFIPIDNIATLSGNDSTLTLTNWYIIRYLDDNKLITKIVITENIAEHLPASPGQHLVSIDRLTDEDFEGTPYFLEIGVIDNDET